MCVGKRQWGVAASDMIHDAFAVFETGLCHAISNRVWYGGDKALSFTYLAVPFSRAFRCLSCVLACVFHLCVSFVLSLVCFICVCHLCAPCVFTFMLTCVCHLCGFTCVCHLCGFTCVWSLLATAIVASDLRPRGGGKMSDMYK